MTIEIWDRVTANGEKVVFVDINGSGKQCANDEAAFEYLQGKVSELKAAIDTAILMYLRREKAGS